MKKLLFRISGTNSEFLNGKETPELTLLCANDVNELNT